MFRILHVYVAYITYIYIYTFIYIVLITYLQIFANSISIYDISTCSVWINRDNICHLKNCKSYQLTLQLLVDNLNDISNEK